MPAAYVSDFDSQSLGITSNQLFCALVGALGSVNFGWNIGVTNVPGDVITKCVTGPRHFDERLPSCIPMNDTTWGIVVGCLALGSMIGALSSTPFSNRYGRRAVLIWSNTFAIAGALIFSLATDLAMLIVGRVLIGIAVGAANGTFTTYVVEISTPKARNTLGAMTQMAIAFGIMLSQTVSLGMSRPPVWRVLFAATGVLSMISMAALTRCVESPRWLLMHHRTGEARHALEQLRRGADCTIEFEKMVGDAQEEMGSHAYSASITDVLLGRTPDNLRHQLMVVAAMMILQQGSGICAVSFYSTSIFELVTNDNPASVPTMAQVLTAILAIVAAVMTFVGMMLAGYLGRRTLMLVSHGAMGASCLLISIGSIKGVAMLTIAMVFVYYSFFVIGSGPIPWLTCSELTPTYAVAAFSAIGGSINYILIFTVGLGFAPMQAALGSYTFLLFAAINFFGFFFCLLFLPETKDHCTADVVRTHSVGIHSVLKAQYRITKG
ncbi:general substrate transporter [Martensiomyces pterosporus]|nr:general substrate transporter [Martensiomyces pterosporus]